MSVETCSVLPDVGRFRVMYDTSLPVVYGFIAFRVGGNRALAEDLTAETFAAAVEKYRAGRADVVTTSWLRTDDGRAALVLRHVEGYSVAEVARIVGRSDKATESLLGRAREAFRTAYSEVDHD